MYDFVLNGCYILQFALTCLLVRLPFSLVSPPCLCLNVEIYVSGFHFLVLCLNGKAIGVPKLGADNSYNIIKVLRTLSMGSVEKRPHTASKGMICVQNTTPAGGCFYEIAWITS